MSYTEVTPVVGPLPPPLAPLGAKPQIRHWTIKGTDGFKESPYTAFNESP